ncbi:hypothetical protein DWF00_03060 [Bosea caraganae]|uniref:VanZ family protein n=1 Tax=Bosea caraganae TaxID=2763117 RepID=A0A370L4V5_9HYPH|nr:hypothetical protein [Bosea caraganae]RDJ24086.1 hypothetical protein DWE98_14290 [Bosea caraganae]RDJ30128.1 hypothetical protein DWF00_03060 [Bosea caraganae]
MNQAVGRETWLGRCLGRIARALDRHAEALRVAAALLGLVLAAIVVFSTLSPLALRPMLTSDADVERFLAFAGVAGCFVFAAPKRWLLILGLAVVLGAGLEAAQNLRPDRHGLWHDLDWKAAGACFGTALALASHALLRRLARPERRD